MTWGPLPPARRPARAAQRFTCPGRCGWHLEHEQTALQEALDDLPRVANGLVPRLRAVDVVEAVLLGHIAACAPAQDALTTARRPWKKAISRQPMRTLRARQDDRAAPPQTNRGDT